MDITNSVFSQRDRALQLGDHESYREQLTRQLASTRKRLGRSTPKNGKFAKPPAITSADLTKNAEFAQLLLLSAERAWAQAMLIKTARSEENNTSYLRGSARAHIISRLQKAAKHAEELVNALSENKGDGSKTDWVEAKAYEYTLLGAAEFEKNAQGPRSDDVDGQRDRLQNCLQNFAAARVVYSTLLKTTKKDVYKEVIASTIDPSIRFASYQAHIPRTAPVITIIKRFFPMEEEDLVEAIKSIDKNAFSESKADGSEDASIPNTITWRNRKANIVDAAIGLALADASSAQARLESLGTDGKSSQEVAGAYDEILTAYQDAADAARHALEEHEKEGINESDPRMQDLRVTYLAVNYDLVSWRIGRNRVLIGSDDGLELQAAPIKKKRAGKADAEGTAERPQKSEGNGRKLARLRERVVLYDAILQSIDSVADLPGAAEAGFRKELEGKRNYFRALKCLNIAYSHAVLANYKNCLALLAHSEQMSAAAKSTEYSPARQESSLPTLDLTKQSLESTHTRIANLTTHYRGLVELQTLENNSKIAAEKHMTSAAPVVERLNDYPVGGVDLKNLVTYPPRLKPVPVKPLFFDLAWNYIEYPGREPAAPAAAAPATSTAAEEKGTPVKKGGLLSGWFGR